MFDDSTTGIAIFALLLAVYGLLTLVFSALNNVRLSVLRDEADDDNAAAQRALDFLERNAHLAITYQVAGALIQFSLAAVAIASFAPPLIDRGLDPVLTGALILLVVAWLTLTLAVLTPEAIGSTYAHRLTLWLLPVARLTEALLKPFSLSVVFVSRLLSSVVASDAQVNTVTEEEIMTLIDAGSSDGAIGAEQKDMIYSVLQLDETHASELMVPRVDMVAVEINTPLEDARALFIRSGHSRIPVYEETIDNIRGLLYAKDLLTYWHNGNRDRIKSLRDLLRPAYFVPETHPASELLKDLKKRRIHMAIVIDEYGGTAGIVTIEDLIEEIIGDIQDEYDLNEEEEYVRLDENRYLVDASMDIDDFNELLDVDLPNEESDTVGGYVFAQVGHVPLVGEEIFYKDELSLRVESVARRRIGKILVTRLQPDEPTPSPGDSERLKAVNLSSPDDSEQ